MPVGAVDSTSASPIPMVQVDFSTDEPTSVDASGDGIRIHTQDILVEEEEVVTPAVGKPGSASLMLKKAMKSKRPKKKEPSIEIDIAGMWDDFEVDNYDDALAEASELGNEPSVPPPLPKGK